MSLDIKFIAFSEKRADEFWAGATMFNFLETFAELERESVTDAERRSYLMGHDLEAGGVMAYVPEGKYFPEQIEALAKAFPTDDASALINNFQTATKEHYIALFDQLSVEAISAKFPSVDQASSLIDLYRALTPAIDQLKDSGYQLLIDVNDDLSMSDYLIKRASQHEAIFNELFTKWQTTRQESSVPTAEVVDGPSQDQASIF